MNLSAPISTDWKSTFFPPINVIFPPSLEGQRPEAAGDGSELLNMIGDLKFIFSHDFSEFFFFLFRMFSFFANRSVSPSGVSLHYPGKYFY